MSPSPRCQRIPGVFIAVALWMLTLPFTLPWISEVYGQSSESSSRSTHTGSASAGSSPLRNMNRPNSGGEAGATGTAAGEAITESVRCKDGSYSPHGGPTACKDHGGMEGPSQPSAHHRSGSASASSEQAASASKGSSTRMASVTSRSKPVAREQAPGGGPGMVWADSQSRRYHCPGDRQYGRTRHGEYMSEADAKSKGYQPRQGKACE